MNFIKKTAITLGILAGCAAAASAPATGEGYRVGVDALPSQKQE